MNTYDPIRPSCMVIAILLALTAQSFADDRAKEKSDDPPTVQSLTTEIRKAYRAADYKKALEAAEKLHALLPDHPLPMYNVACMNALLGDKDKAYTWLDKAVAAGYADHAHLLNDADLRTMWGEQRFRDIVKRIRDRDGRKPRPDETTGPDKPTPSAQTTKAPDVEREVEFTYVITPPDEYDASKPAPLIVALHGFRGDMNATTTQWKNAAAAVNAVLLAPQGTSQIGEDAFHWGDDVAKIEKNIMRAINAAMDQHKIDEDRIVIVGFSQGARMAYELAMRNPDTFRGLVPVAGRFQPSSDSPFSGDRLKRLRVYIMVGAEDKAETIASNEKAVSLFSSAGAAVKLVKYDGVGHGFPKEADREQTKALRFVLE